MKKAAIYARVSSDIQRKEKTIDSQIIELKKQVASAGDILVKEYIDDGFSGARLDRPAMDQLRKDLKVNLFDTIYFLNTDRIARDVTYQTIIIAEILKQRKQIIINGKDYINNSENKFTLTVLGAVAELERAKIAERVGRGKALKLAMGYHSGRGSNIYGYDYILKAPDKPSGELKINEKEAKIIQLAFEMYAKGNCGLNQVVKKFETMGVQTKKGRKLWWRSILKTMLQNETYAGTAYANKMVYTKEYANPLFGTASKTKIVHRPKSEWVGIKVPAIVSKALFDKVQKRFDWNQKHYRNPRKIQLLSTLIKCGSCGRSCFGYRRYYVEKRSKPHKVYHKMAYKCNWRLRAGVHLESSGVKKCHNKEIKSEILESKVFDMIREWMLDPTKLRECMDFFRGKTQAAQLRVERRLKRIDELIKKITVKKKRVIDLYASSTLDQRGYIEKNLEYDNEENKLKAERSDLTRRIPLLHKTEIVDASIKQYCESLKVRLNRCSDFDMKRKFVLDYVEKIVYNNDSVVLRGSVPVKMKAYESSDLAEASKLEFKLSDRISASERLGRKFDSRPLSAQRGSTK
jgi:site-specific DNA recombinase